MTVTLNDTARRGFAADSLVGLSVGDALGAQYFVPGNRFADLAAGTVPPPVWQWTDDTEMACSVFWMLSAAGTIDRDRLAAAFAERCEPNRGYGAGAFTILRRIRTGTPWQLAAAEVFGGQGSCGNGAAMRVAPVGAWFADSPRRAAAEAAASAEVTHAHPEGSAGAVAVAVGASVAAAARLEGRRPAAGRYLDEVTAHVPPGRVHHGLRRARQLLRVPIAEAAYELGNGGQVTAQDTVPFTLWVAARFLDDYPGAIRACVEAGGDADTTSAIAGGIVAAYAGAEGVPPDWRAATEDLPDWTAG